MRDKPEHEPMVCVCVMCCNRRPKTAQTTIPASRVIYDLGKLTSIMVEHSNFSIKSTCVFRISFLFYFSSWYIVYRSISDYASWGVVVSELAENYSQMETHCGKTPSIESRTNMCECCLSKYVCVCDDDVRSCVW